MYTIEKGQNKKYTEYTLIDEENKTSCKINPENGGMLISFVKDGYEYIYLDEDNFYYGEKPSTANPILFPINGQLENDKYIYEGKEYTIPSHGFARRRDWKVESTSDKDCASISIYLEDDEETFKNYPFHFKVTYTYELKNNELTISQRYENTGDNDMPFTYGIHPYFNVESVDTTEVYVDAEESRLWVRGNFEEFKPWDSKPFILDVEYGEGQRQFKSTKSPLVLKDKARNKKVTIEMDENFPIAVCWAKKDNGFICLEPWSQIQNAFNLGIEETLKAKEVKEVKVKIIVD